MKLHVQVETDADGRNTVIVTGDAVGLERLSKACQAISGKDGPGAHFHFEWEMNNLTKGSMPLTLRHSK